MGKVRPKYIKNIARRLVEIYGDRFSDDFEENKKLLMELADVPSKAVRNRMAGEITRIIRRSREGAEEVTE
jgi:small subunit ribosomal protein S17e